jgi:hypothetical protein
MCGKMILDRTWLALERTHTGSRVPPLAQTACATRQEKSHGCWHSYSHGTPRSELVWDPLPCCNHLLLSGIPLEAGSLRPCTDDSSTTWRCSDEGLDSIVVDSQAASAILGSEVWTGQICRRVQLPCCHRAAEGSDPIYRWGNRLLAACKKDSSGCSVGSLLRMERRVERRRNLRVRVRKRRRMHWMSCTRESEPAGAETRADTRTMCCASRSVTVVPFSILDLSRSSRLSNRLILPHLLYPVCSPSSWCNLCPKRQTRNISGGHGRPVAPPS